jgi:membrane-anchored protein YejM (alkaline phosphatase superfamily)
LARRLVERGVPFVTVNSSGWDTHQDVIKLKERYPGDQNAHLPSLDRALSALIEDLSDRGRLHETLVVVMGENMDS